LPAAEERQGWDGDDMIEDILLLTISGLLLVYLVYALLRPEKF
jgi:K+-transporting ATPase KdpF subunit